MKGCKKRVMSALLALTVMCGINIPICAEEQTAPQEIQDITEETNEELSVQDSDYDEAIGLLSYLNIFTGYEDGSMKPESKITRSEMAAIILRTIKLDTLAEYRGGFIDVDGGHWAADIIQTAYNNGIINGMGDGTFAPDESVTYEQAVKMAVCAVNCGERAEDSGGYPNGYIAEAARKDIIKHVSCAIGEEITRLNVAKIIYNALLTEYPVVKGSSVHYGNTAYEFEETEGITLLSEKFDIYYVDGIIMATAQKSIDLSTDLLENQILFEDKVMKSTIKNANDLVAQYCRVFYLDTEGDYDDVTAVYAITNESKTESITISADNIDSIVTGYEGGTPEIKYYKETSGTATLKLVDRPTIVYNDNPFTLANYSKVNPTDENGEIISFDEFITPDTGSVRAVDFDDNGRYDILFVENYETSVVKLATVLRLQLKYPISVGDMINLDKSKYEDLNIFVTKDGEETELRNLAENDVVSIKMNANFGDSTYTGKKFIYIEASSDYVEGKLTSVSDGDRNAEAIIDGEEFDVVNNDSVLKDLRSNIGMQTRFLLDKFGKIAYVKSVTTGGLSGSEKYGWLVDIYETDSREDAEAKIYTQDATFETYELASSVDYWGSEDTTSSKKNGIEIVKLIQDKTNGFTECNTVEKNGDIKDSVEMRLCKYKMNSNNEITRLYLAVDEKKVSMDSGALRLDTKDYRNGKLTSSMFAGKYLIEDPVPQFTVPESRDDKNDSSIYKYRFAPASEFNKAGDTSVGYNCFLADVSDYAPGIAVRLAGGSNKSASLDSYDTSDDNSVFVITDILTGVDDDDNEIYVLKGICDGEEVSYTTTKNTIVAHVNPAVRKDKSTYDTTTIWKDSYESTLNEVLHKGDICGVKGSAAEAEVILRMVDATSLANHLVNDEGKLGTVSVTQFRKDEQFSSSRDRVIFGYVTDTRTSPIVQLDVSVDDSTSADEDGEVTEDGSKSISVGMNDFSKAVTVINISQKGKITVDKELSDIYEIQTGDYIFMRRFKNDALREVYVVRYE